jgi:hypothetical protein
MEGASWPRESVDNKQVSLCVSTPPLPSPSTHPRELKPYTPPLSRQSPTRANSRTKSIRPPIHPYLTQHPFFVLNVFDLQVPARQYQACQRLAGTTAPAADGVRALENTHSVGDVQRHETHGATLEALYGGGRLSL